MADSCRNVHSWWITYLGISGGNLMRFLSGKVSLHKSRSSNGERDREHGTSGLESSNNIFFVGRNSASYPQRWVSTSLPDSHAGIQGGASQRSCISENPTLLASRNSWEGGGSVSQHRKYMLAGLMTKGQNPHSLTNPDSVLGKDREAIGELVPSLSIKHWASREDCKTTLEKWF